MVNGGVEVILTDGRYNINLLGYLKLVKYKITKIAVNYTLIKESKS